MSIPLSGGLNLARERMAYGSDELFSLFPLIVIHNGRPQELCLFVCFFLRAFSVYCSAQVLGLQNHVLKLFDSFSSPYHNLFFFSSSSFSPSLLLSPFPRRLSLFLNLNSCVCLRFRSVCVSLSFFFCFWISGSVPEK